MSVVAAEVQGKQLSTRLAPGRTIGKYRLGRQIGHGGFGTVYKAKDLVEGVDVALKIPSAHSQGQLSRLLKEVRITLRLEHPNILRVRNATWADGLLVMAYPLGTGNLAERMRHRMASRTGLAVVEQLIDALAYAHHRRVIHCDINPTNVILFPQNHVRLADFGLAKVATRTRTLTGSGSGTVGYIAPEQAMGRPSFRSDVFSLGLLFYRLFSGQLPWWPYRAPLPGMDRLRRKLQPEFIEFLLRTLEVDERKRFKNAVAMNTAFQRLRGRTLRD